jgi:hypothetical protein
MTSHDAENAIKVESALSGHNESTLPSDQAIREKAYFLYKQRGGRDGFALDDWLNAESAFRVPETSTQYVAQIQEEKSKAARVGFIKAGLDNAVTFSGAAVEAQGARDTSHERVNARSLYHTATRKVDKVELKESDAGEIEEKADKVKSNFNKLGESL